ncbi:MAG: M23 family metallopeptidase [Clostridia bacterium]|nr:M23 family metallopeptidase [Clostridia bacterium]
MRNYTRPTDKAYRPTFLKKTTICAIALIILSILKITPDDVFTKSKNAVSLILNQHTDIKEEAIKIKDFFTKDTSLTAMNPVSEFVSPAKNAHITKGFGVQDATTDTFHYGIDLKVEPDENICSVATGEITEIATNEEYGSYIVIRHNDEISTLYAHLNEILPNVGATVEAGQAIARANNENNTIYFEIKKGDTYLNPEEFIDFENSGDAAND